MAEALATCFHTQFNRHFYYSTEILTTDEASACESSGREHKISTSSSLGPPIAAVVAGLRRARSPQTKGVPQNWLLERIEVWKKYRVQACWLIHTRTRTVSVMAQAFHKTRPPTALLYLLMTLSDVMSHASSVVLREKQLRDSAQNATI
jgi:hypothetical protein